MFNFDDTQEFPLSDFDLIDLEWTELSNVIGGAAPPPPATVLPDPIIDLFWTERYVRWHGDNG